MKFGQCTSYYKIKKLSKNLKNCNVKSSSKAFCVCKELSTTSTGKCFFLKQAAYIRYVIAKISKFVQVSM